MTEINKRSKFIPAYMNAGYGWYSDYLASDEWAATKARYKKANRPMYCFICDSKIYINIHHEEYSRIPNENVYTDIIALCGGCHARVHKLDNGERTPLVKPELMKRRLELRRRYIKQHLKPSTFIYFIRKWLYRLFW